MISPSNVEVDIGETLQPDEYIGMTRREVLDDFLRQRAVKNGAKTINGLFINMEMKEGPQGPITLHYNDFEAEGARDVKAGIPAEIEVDCVIGADGANSRVAKDRRRGVRLRRRLPGADQDLPR